MYARSAQSTDQDYLLPIRVTESMRSSSFVSTQRATEKQYIT